MFYSTTTCPNLHVPCMIYVPCMIQKYVYRQIFTRHDISTSKMNMFCFCISHPLPNHQMYRKMSLKNVLLNSNMFKKFMSHAWFSPRRSPGGLFQIRDMFTRHDITTSKNKYFLFLYCPSSSEWSDVSKNVIKNGFTQQQHVQNLCVPYMIFFFFSGGFPGDFRGPPDISKIFPRKSRGLLWRG